MCLQVLRDPKIRFSWIPGQLHFKTVFYLRRKHRYPGSFPSNLNMTFSCNITERFIQILCAWYLHTRVILMLLKVRFEAKWKRYVLLFYSVFCCWRRLFLLFSFGHDYNLTPSRTNALVNRFFFPEHTTFEKRSDLVNLYSNHLLHALGSSVLFTSVHIARTRNLRVNTI